MPVLQFKQVENPALEYLPATQLVAEVAPAVLTYVPAIDIAQVLWPLWELNLPVWQSVQIEVATLAANLPAAQLVHALLDPPDLYVEYLPTSHGFLELAPKVSA